MSTDATQRRVQECPAGLEQDLAEVETAVFKRLGELADQIVALRREVADLQAGLAANTERDVQREAFIVSLGRMSEALAAEAARVSGDR